MVSPNLTEWKIFTKNSVNLIFRNLFVFLVSAKAGQHARMFYSTTHAFSYGFKKAFFIPSNEAIVFKRSKNDRSFTMRVELELTVYSWRILNVVHFYTHLRNPH
jgi:hypothetical protein